MVWKLNILGVALLPLAIMAQQAATTMDLANPIFSQHASLPVNETPGPQIVPSLQPQLSGKPGSTVYTSVHDEDTGLGSYPSFSSLYEDLTCRADSVLIGKVKNASSHLTASEAAIYTDYDFAIEAVLRNRSTSALHPTSHVVITRPGGRLAVSGGFIDYNHGAFLRPREGRTYLLFLHQIPGSGAYQPAEDARKRLVFSTLELDSSGNRWTIYRSAYMNRSPAELSEESIRSIIGKTAASCTQN